MPRHGFNVLSQGDGCDLHPVCQTCPLSMCRFEMAPGKARMEMETLRLDAHLREGKTMDEAAAAMGLSRRTVYRLRKQEREAEHGRPTGDGA